MGFKASKTTEGQKIVLWSLLMDLETDKPGYKKNVCGQCVNEEQIWSQNNLQICRGSSIFGKQWVINLFFFPTRFWTENTKKNTSLHTDERCSHSLPSQPYRGRPEDSLGQVEVRVLCQVEGHKGPSNETVAEMCALPCHSIPGLQLMIPFTLQLLQYTFHFQFICSRPGQVQRIAFVGFILNDKNRLFIA